VNAAGGYGESRCAHWRVVRDVRNHRRRRGRENNRDHTGRPAPLHKGRQLECGRGALRNDLRVIPDDLAALSDVQIRTTVADDHN
jgi:hypothetical protein